MAVLMVSARPAGAQQTAGLAEARNRADKISRQITEAQGELEALDAEMVELGEQNDATQAELDALAERVRELAVRRYTAHGNDRVFIPGADVNTQERADALASFVTQGDSDALDAYRATKNRLERTTAELEARRSEYDRRLGELNKSRDELYGQLARLEAEEARRVQAEREAAEKAAREVADAQEREKASERADQLAARQQATETGRAVAAEGSRRSDGSTPTTQPRPAPSAPIASGAFVCPVQGAVSFVNSWGNARASGNRHVGVDMMSPRGTPVVIPVSGTVTTKTGGIGGLQFHLNGDDGTFYYGAHMDAFSGAQGHLPAGTVVGYVGDTGDAKGTGTHLHFEIHPGGWSNPINPYDTVSRYC